MLFSPTVAKEGDVTFGQFVEGVAPEQSAPAM
jgi:hypothetical protein